jgi:hypothetical protein
MTTLGQARTHGSGREWAIGIEVARITALVTAAILSIVVILPGLLELAAGR